MISLLTEFEQRTKASVVDEKIYEMDGRRVLANKQWLSQALTVESSELKSRFDHLFENVNY